MLYIFAVLGFNTRRVVEVCCGNGQESNTANLLVNHRCTGLLFEGSEALASAARQFYAEQPSTMFWPPTVVRDWITAENIDGLISEAGITGDIDLLSIDIDGIDYWLWDRIDIISPRVVVAEINHLWGAQESVTVPYAPDFKAVFTQYGSDYAGASIAAFVKLGRRKGYHLVGGNAIGTNVFFVRDDLSHPWLPEVAAETLFWHPRAKFGQTVRIEGVRSMDWEQV
ncbi:hypothetical protein [Caballeronia sp. AZ7_KS35]|uniref:hypothetical protein n=1 Tax=Caballeronia sp. AZ7_KS35 TaxID=2921762 RepID=UPI002028E1C8|nr:hypothetical protein [Caballeronia sp. AZ7_KS35]